MNDHENELGNLPFVNSTPPFTSEIHYHVTQDTQLRQDVDRMQIEINRLRNQIHLLKTAFILLNRNR